MHKFDILKYVEMAKRRIYWILVPFMVVLLIGLGYALTIEPVYEAQTLILVQPQEVPQSFVRPIVQRGVEERLRTITQQVTSRTNIESVISDHGLYAGSDMLLESKVERCRKNIRIDVGGRGGGNTFAIYFKHVDPEKAKDVTNALASNFISENLKIRESQALGTSSFLADELENVRRRLEVKEEAIKEYRQKHMGGMPDQLETNLSMLARMQSKLEQLNASLRDAQNRKLIIQEQMASQRRMAEQMSQMSMSQNLFELEEPEETGGSGELAELEETLASLRNRYTDNHPDVRRVKRMIEKLKEKEAEPVEEDFLSEPQAEADLEPEGGMDEMPMMPSAEETLKPQLNQVDYEIERIREEIAKTEERLQVYERRVEEAPQREQELYSLRRDYDNLKSLYDSLLNRKLEAEIAVSMEKKQKGEQFRILDSAKRPEIPVAPDLRKILMLTLVLGLGLGAGLAYLKETMDTSFKDPGEVTELLGIPVLVSLPFRLTAREQRIMKLKSRLKAAGLAVGFFACAFAIVAAAKGLEKTLNFAKELLPFIGA
ncbi:MAG: XrtA system polysaccharide chain length determinant [Desulfobacteraceae bacterium]